MRGLLQRGLAGMAVVLPVVGAGPAERDATSRRLPLALSCAFGGKSSVRLDTTSLEDGPFRIEVRGRMRQAQSGADGWFGVEIGDPGGTTPGLLVHRRSSGSFFLHDRRTDRRVGLFRPVLPAGRVSDGGVEATPIDWRIDVQRSIPRDGFCIRIHADGAFVGERVFPSAEFALGVGRLGFGLAVCEGVDAVIDDVTILPIRASPWPQYPILGEPTEAGAAVPRSSPPADTLYLLEVADAPFPATYLGVVLQGLVNRECPRILTDFHGYESVQVGRRDWSFLAEADGRRMVRGSSPGDLLRRFRALVRGVVIYDPGWFEDPLRKPLIHVVTNACALGDLVPMTPEQYARMGTELDLEVMLDARERWEDGRVGFEWSVDNQLPRSSRDAVVHLPVHRPSFATLDYAVAHRLFVFMSAAYDGTVDEYRGYERVLASTRPCGLVLGMTWLERMGGAPANYFTESVLFGLCGELGKGFVYTMNCGNLSYHSGTALQPIAPRPPRIEYDPGRVYVCFIASDGDNGSWAMNLRLKAADDPARDRIPAGWTFPPSFAYLCPDVAAWYGRTARPGEGYVASGGGLANMPYGHSVDRFGIRLPPHQREPVLARWLEVSARAMRDAGLRVSNPFCEDTAGLERLAAAMPSVRIFFPGYNVSNAGRPREDRIYRTTGGAWVARWWCAHPGGGKELPDRYARAIRAAAAAGERFVPVWCLGNTVINGVGPLARVAELLPDQFEIVGPEQFADLLDQAEGVGDLP